MHLLTFRIVGHPAIVNTHWIHVDRGINVFRSTRTDQSRALLQMLQTIHPPYDVRQSDPFRDLPLSIAGPGYTRKIIPGKKTAAIAVFAASSELVQGLTTIDPLYYAADRVEFGRRRDYSRWTNFVELAGSTRWSEIEPAVSDLLSRIGKDGGAVADQLRSAIADLRGADRIRGEIEGELRERLEALRRFLPEKALAGLDACVHAVNRAQHFREARQLAAEHLPCFFSVNTATAGHIPKPADSPLAAAAGLSPLDFLAGGLDNDHTGKAAIAHSLERINLALQTGYSQLALHCRLNEGKITLESGKGPYARPLPELVPVRRIEALLAAATVIHEEIRGNLPIWLIDLSEMQLDAAEQAQLLQFLCRHGARWQCLVIPDNGFLSLCTEKAAEAGKAGVPPITLVD
jgi:hypothetical protein